MSRHGRRLSPEEADLWAGVAQTVTPLDGAAGRHRPPVGDAQPQTQPAISAGSARPATSAPAPVPAQRPRVLAAHGLDTGWDRKLGRGLVDPDFTLDLHGCTLDAAHARLMHGLTQAKTMGARLVLLVTGKPRPADPADRGSRRGVIRSKVIDWLAASDHALDIAAIRGAHRRHGGQGALYIVLKRRRA